MPRPWPFLGRDAQHLLVMDLIAAGSGVLLLGEPGVGKSALATAVRGSLDSTPVGAVAGRYASSGTSFEVFSAVLVDSPGDAAGQQPLSAPLVARLVAERLGASTDHPGVLFVDDIHLLDALSAQVVLQLATDATVIVIGTAPGADVLPPAVERLWHEGRSECIELVPLDDESVEAVLEAVLDAPVDEATVRRFCSRAQGNPLLLRELVTAALAGGGFRRKRDTWTLTGPLVVSSGIRAVMSRRLAGVEEDQREALEALAAAEPLRLAAAERLVGGELLDLLEAERLVVVRDELAGPVVACAHPLYGDVLRESLPLLRRHRLRLTAARALEADPAPTAHELVRAALWRLDAGQPDTPARLLAAARAARPLSLETAERLARAAHRRDPSPHTTMALIEILTYRNKFVEAEDLAARLPPEQLTPADRAAIAYCQGIGQGLLTGDLTVGTQLVGAALAGSADASNQLRALHSALLAFDARFEDSIRVGAPITRDASIEAPARAVAAIGVVGSEYWLGRTRRAVQEAARVPYDDEDCREAVPFAGPAVELTAICALLEEGLLDTAAERADRMRAQADALADPFAGPRARYCQARVALARGRSRTALRLLRHCMDLLSDFDRPSIRHIRATAARAAAAHGDLTTARALLVVPDAPALKTYEQERILAEAAVQAAELHLTEAADRAAWAGDVATSLCQWNVAASAYHDAARYGLTRAVLEPLQEAADHVDGDLAGWYVRHTRALADHDGSTLAAVARGFQRLGLLLFAAEAAAEAALAHAASNDVRPSRASGLLAEELFAQCEGAVAPWLAGATTGVSLTDRERQVAALAASGRTDADIAAHLGISRRTVETHLAHVYAKLGVTGRSHLPRDLVSRPEPWPGYEVATDA